MLKVRARNLEKITILCLQGQIVTGETDILCSVFEALPETSEVVLDLTRVSKIDAHGLGVLLELREQTQAKGIRFELMNVHKPLDMVLEITHLDSVFQIISGVEYFPLVSPERQEWIAALKPCA